MTRSQASLVAVGTALPGGPPHRSQRAQIVTHYFHHGAWLEDDQLLRDAHRLTGIPGVLVHGRLDFGSPPDVAWQLAQAWPDAELHLVPTGHFGGAEMVSRLVDGTNHFAGRS